MSKLESDESVQNSEPEHKFTMAEPAAMFLLRALQELRLVDDTITVEDLHTFADEVREDMGLMIGSEELLAEIFDVNNQGNFYYRKSHYELADELREKILQAQQNQAKKDREFLF